MGIIDLKAGENMLVGIQEFIQNTYHFLTEIINKDLILKVITKKGNVVILSEERYDTMMKMVEENMIVRSCSKE